MSRLYRCKPGPAGGFTPWDQIVTHLWRAPSFADGELAAPVASAGLVP